MRPKTPTSFRLSEEARAWLVQLADNESTTQTAYVERLIREAYAAYKAREPRGWPAGRRRTEGTDAS